MANLKEDPPLPSRQAGGRASGAAVASAILWRCSVGGAGLDSASGSLAAPAPAARAPGTYEKQPPLPGE
ncbi:Hypothetical predicted protein [Podarcis lilfordi]|uniref:Uncharacterized protein n=1 Tax=Podarcis lilfordi TaxID=74358 RepID=A0AA35KIK2_9SAUR|nr:Hypothetical predicted protein [Podarcis lilfordi]